MVTIARFDKSEDAHLLRLRLEAAGVEAFVQDENICQWLWLYATAYGGIRVEVRDGDLEAAREVLSIPHQDPVDVDSLTCPSCGSAEVVQYDPPIRLDFLSVLFLSFPLPFLPKTHRCGSCTHKWRNR